MLVELVENKKTSHWSDIEYLKRIKDCMVFEFDWESWVYARSLPTEELMAYSMAASEEAIALPGKNIWIEAETPPSEDWPEGMIVAYNFIDTEIERAYAAVITCTVYTIINPISEPNELLTEHFVYFIEEGKMGVGVCANENLYSLLEPFPRGEDVFKAMKPFMYHTETLKGLAKLHEFKSLDPEKIKIQKILLRQAIEGVLMTGWINFPVTYSLKESNSAYESSSALRKKYPLRGKPKTIVLTHDRVRYYQAKCNIAVKEQRAAHQRRGHFRVVEGRMQDGVFIKYTKNKHWVRPAWIGPENWENKGRKYKLIK